MRLRGFHPDGLRVEGFRTQGLGFRVEGFRIQGLGFRVEGFRIQGLGCGIGTQRGYCSPFDCMPCILSFKRRQP